MARLRLQLFTLSDRVRSSLAMAWSVAFAAFLCALYARFIFDQLLPAGFPYLTFFPAVILTAFFAGVWPGAACALACGVAAWYWFIPPFGSFSLDSSVLVALAFYACVVGVDILLIQVMHRAVDGLREERARSRDLAREQQRLLMEQKDRDQQQRILQRELSHRMKNTLAMVQAVVSQSLRNSQDPKLASGLASARIQALARAQDALTATDWSAADVETLIRTAVSPHDDGTLRFRLDGPPIALEAQRSLGLALAIHELATNATKYGALKPEAGRVAICWDISGDNGFRFSWTETEGPLVEEPSRRGFGSRLTERVVPAYFKGTAKTRYAAGGVEYELEGTLRSDEAERVRE
jgi:two-component sensor histidine kinase